MSVQGDVRVEANGKVWTLRMDFNALCAFEDMTGENAMETLQVFESGKIGLRRLRELILCGLQRHHPEASLLDAGDILTAIPDALARSIGAALPAPAEVPVGNAPSRATSKAPRRR